MFFARSHKMSTEQTLKLNTSVEHLHVSIDGLIGWIYRLYWAVQAVVLNPSEKNFKNIGELFPILERDIVMAMGDVSYANEVYTTALNDAQIFYDLDDERMQHIKKTSSNYNVSKSYKDMQVGNIWNMCLEFKAAMNAMDKFLNEYCREMLKIDALADIGKFVDPLESDVCVNFLKMPMCYDFNKYHRRAMEIQENMIAPLAPIVDDLEKRDITRSLDGRYDFFHRVVSYRIVEEFAVGDIDDNIRNMCDILTLNVREVEVSDKLDKFRKLVFKSIMKLQDLLESEKTISPKIHMELRNYCLQILPNNYEHVIPENLKGLVAKNLSHIIIAIFEHSD